ncbi:hypothetical protein BD410DRAFT_807570 [Rickenella mellea]|uniref:Uncharacterized protein n=1 Tax=Rickenella mellea TaxID=50990 RepID=A0A4Y7PRL2_9AGAM|nr:hypothetical protein BD410DRAFT_807570 [Rickenella mellea]
MAGNDNNPTTSRGLSNPIASKTQSKSGTAAPTVAPNANKDDPAKPTTNIQSSKPASNILSTAKSAKLYLIENKLAITNTEYTLATLIDILLQLSHNASLSSKTVRECACAVAILLQDLSDKNTAKAILTYITIGLNSQLTKLQETSETINEAAKKLESTISTLTTTINSASNNLENESQRITRVINELHVDACKLVINLEAAIDELPTAPAPQHITADQTNIPAPRGMVDNLELAFSSNTVGH